MLKHQKQEVQTLLTFSRHRLKYYDIISLKKEALVEKNKFTPLTCKYNSHILKSSVRQTVLILKWYIYLQEVCVEDILNIDIRNKVPDKETKRYGVYIESFYHKTVRRLDRR